MKTRTTQRKEIQPTIPIMKKIMSTLFVMAIPILSASSLRAQDVSVDGFYSYITNLASQSGFNTSSLSSTPDATYEEAVDSYFWGLPLEETYRTQNLVDAGYGISPNTLFASQNLNTSTTVVAPSEDRLTEDQQQARVELTIFEGRKRQVRRMMALVGHPVIRLTRVGIGTVRLSGLPAGAWRHLTPTEIAGLMNAKTSHNA